MTELKPSDFARLGQPCCSRWGKSEIEWIALSYVQALANDGDVWKKLTRDEVKTRLTAEQSRQVHGLLDGSYYQGWFDAVADQISDSEGALGVGGFWNEYRLTRASQGELFPGNDVGRVRVMRPSQRLQHCAAELADIAKNPPREVNGHELARLSSRLLAVAAHVAIGERSIIVCPNCDTDLPIGCGGTFKESDGDSCWLNRTVQETASTSGTALAQVSETAEAGHSAKEPEATEFWEPTQETNVGRAR
jgi:hypothetical protein